MSIYVHYVVSAKFDRAGRLLGDERPLYAPVSEDQPLEGRCAFRLHHAGGGVVADSRSGCSVPTMSILADEDLRGWLVVGETGPSLLAMSEDPPFGPGTWGESLRFVQPLHRRWKAGASFCEVLHSAAPPMATLEVPRVREFVAELCERLAPAEVNYGAWLTGDGVPASPPTQRWLSSFEGMPVDLVLREPERARMIIAEATSQMRAWLSRRGVGLGPGLFGRAGQYWLANNSFLSISFASDATRGVFRLGVNLITATQGTTLISLDKPPSNALLGDGWLPDLMDAVVAWAATVEESPSWFRAFRDGVAWHGKTTCSALR